MRLPILGFSALLLAACTVGSDPATSAPPAPTPSPEPDPVTLESLGLDASDAFGPAGAPVPGGAEIVTLAELRSTLAAGRPLFVTAVGAQKVEHLAVLAEQADDATIANQLATSFDPRVQALVDAEPTFDARARRRADGNVDFDAMRVDGSTSTVVTMGKTNRRHLIAEVMRTGGTRANREEVYRAGYSALPAFVGGGLPAPTSLSTLSDAELDLALSRLGETARDLAASASPATLMFEIDELCGLEVTGVTSIYGGQGATRLRAADYFHHAHKGLFAQMWWLHKKATTCVRDQGTRSTGGAFATASAFERKIAIDSSTRVHISEQDLYATYKSGQGEWFLDGLWPDQLTLWAGLNGYQAGVLYGWDYNRSSKRTGDGFKGVCAGYAGPCTETAPQMPLKCYIANQPLCWQPAPPPKMAPTFSFLNDPQRPHGRVMTNFRVPQGALDLAIGLLTWSDRQVIMSFNVVSSFEATQADGYVTGMGGADRGGHAAHAVAWIPNSKVPFGIAQGAGGGYFVLKNSWGRNAGDQGYYYVPYDWMADNLLDVVAM